MSQRDRLLDQIRRIALQGMGERRTDGQLLEQFISERDEGAFALLLRRHGAMVWSVCRRVLGNPHDADDAFQAAFLVLVRKADSVRPREAVGNWLYGVAYRTALEARSRIARRRSKELSLQAARPLLLQAEEPPQELGPILDRELSRLADKYRLPIVLCDLEGRSRKEVAQQLAISEGTLSSRLATARKKLAVRLARLGFALSGASLAALLAESTAATGMGPTLFTTTTKAALMCAAGPAVATGVVSATVHTLTEGVIKTMFIAKIKTTALVLCSVAALGVGTGGVYYQTRAGEVDSPQEISSGQKPTAKTNRRAEQETERLRRIAEKLKEQLEVEREKAKRTEQELRALAERLRRELVEIRKNMEVMQHDAEAREKRAQGVLARQQRGQTPPPPNPAALEAFEQERKRIVEQVQGQRNELRMQQQKLEAEQKQLEEELRKRVEGLADRRNKFKATEQQLIEDARQKLTRLDEMKAQFLREQEANQSNAKNSPACGDGDKLDQILQRLERLEKRLDRLEERTPLKP